MSICGHLDCVRDGARLVIASVIHAASDHALREPEQANEAGRDDQQSQGSSGESGVKNYSVRERAILELLAS